MAAEALVNSLVGARRASPCMLKLGRGTPRPYIDPMPYALASFALGSRPSAVLSAFCLLPLPFDNPSPTP